MSAHSRQGFTLIEILVAISIVAVVMGAIITSAVAVRRSGRDAQRQSDLRSLQSALQNYYADQNFYPNSPASNNISTGYTSITNCTSRTSCTVSQTYLSLTPTDPSSIQYKYKAVMDAGSGKATECTGSANTNSCQFYILCAQLEGTSPQSGTQNSDCSSLFTANSKPYNYQVTP